MPTVEVVAGSKLVPLEVEKSGKKLALRSGYYKSLIEEFKCMRGAEWDAENKAWRVTDCRRNWIQLESLQGKTPSELERYLLPIQEVTPNRPTLMKHQREMLNFALTRRRCILAAEQGTGKTLVAVEIMEHVPGDWWYVAPLKVTRAIELEFRKWGCKVTPKLVHYDILHRELEARFRCRACSAEFNESRTYSKAGERRCSICKRDDFERLPDRPAPDGVIFDESSFLKTSGTKRTDAAQHLANSIREEKDGFVIEMSGTPAPGDPTDWQPQAEIACPGYLRESSPNHLLRRLAIIEKGETAEGRAFPKTIGWRNNEVSLLYERLKGLVEIHFAKDCLDLPELRHEVIKLEPSEEMKRAARLVAQTSLNTVQALNRLRQLSDGFQYGAQKPCPICLESPHGECPGCDGVGFVLSDAVRAPCPKDDALAGLLGRSEETGRIVVYAGYHESVDRVVDVCRAEKWSVLRCDGRGWASFDTEVEGESALLAEMDASTRTDRIERLAFVAHPGSGGYGLNLTAAVSNVIYSLDFNAASYWQAIKRSHRTGQTRGVTIYRLSHLGTDDLVFRNLEQKRALQALTLGEIEEALS